jgi:acetyl-CoA carboxylase carboxyl transferase subunit beta
MFKKTEIRVSEKMTRSGKKAGKRGQEEPQVPKGLFQKCPSCGDPIYSEDMAENYYSCPRCKSYFRIRPRTRIRMIIDEGTFEEWDQGLESSDPLNFPGYKKKLSHLKQVTNLEEAVVTGKGTINGLPVVIAVMGTDFMMGSMGEVVGEKITRAVERATEERLPVIIFTCSGGARMQEGMVSLMQMAKTSAALKKHDEAGLLYITVLTDPTTGGVTASFAMLGDVILAEPKALIGFAGPRVIQQTIGQKLPEGFQTAEFLLEHGFVDKIVERRNLKYVLYSIIRSC